MSRWNTNIHWSKERRGSHTLAELIDGDLVIRIVDFNESHGYRIYDQEIWKDSGIIHHRENGLQSSMIRAEKILIDYKAKRDAEAHR